jgi:hypothetical protein
VSNDDGLPDSQSKSTEATTAELLLYSESGDKWFKVTRKDRSRQRLLDWGAGPL